MFDDQASRSMTRRPGATMADPCSGKPWYKPTMSRAACEAALSGSGVNVGAFLVRRSTSRPGCYSMGVNLGNSTIQSWLVKQVCQSRALFVEETRVDVPLTPRTPLLHTPAHWPLPLPRRHCHPLPCPFPLPPVPWRSIWKTSTGCFCFDGVEGISYPSLLKLVELCLVDGVPTVLGTRVRIAMLQRGAGRDASAVALASDLHGSNPFAAKGRGERRPWTCPCGALNVAAASAW